MAAVKGRGQWRRVKGPAGNGGGEGGAAKKSAAMFRGKKGAGRGRMAKAAEEMGDGGMKKDGRFVAGMRKRVYLCK